MLPAAESLFEAHLPVSDVDASIAFYRDVIGLPVAYIVPGGQAAFFWIGSRGNTMLGVWAAGPGPQKTTLHIALRTTVDDVINAPSAMKAAGITPLDFDGRPTDEPVVLGWMPAIAIYFRDPDGHLLEYLAMLADAPRPERGVVGWREWQTR